MSFFDEMKESLVSAGKDVSQKAKEVSGVAKLKLDVKSKEDYVEKQYAELGRTYFDAHRDDEENAENEQFTVIKEALAEIERMKTEILNLQGEAQGRRVDRQTSRFFQRQNRKRISPTPPSPFRPATFCAHCRRS